MQLDLTGTVVLVVGAASGIGRAGALSLAKHGAIVSIGDADARGADTAAAIRQLGGRASFRQTDVTNPLAVAALVEDTVDRYGRLDVAWNNAGILPPPRRLHEVSDADWSRALDVDLTGVFYCMRDEITWMLEHGGGSIINTASVAGLIGDPKMSPYVAAKHGVIGLTRAAAMDYGDAGIRVNAIAPGLCGPQ